MSAARDAAGWFICRAHGATGSAARILCFPHAGGNPRAFLDWQAGLGDDGEILAICRRGRDHRAAEPAPTIEEFIGGATAAISAVARDGRPSYLFGHSLGALVAFEVCRKLADAGSAAPRHLIASGCSAPSLLPSQRVKRIATLTGQEFAEAIGFFGGLPAEVIADESLRDLLLPALIGDFQWRSATATGQVRRSPCPRRSWSGGTTRTSSSRRSSRGTPSSPGRPTGTGLTAATSIRTATRRDHRHLAVGGQGRPARRGDLSGQPHGVLART